MQFLSLLNHKLIHVTFWTCQTCIQSDFQKITTKQKCAEKMRNFMHFKLPNVILPKTNSPEICVNCPDTKNYVHLELFDQFCCHVGVVDNAYKFVKSTLM